MSSTGKTNGNCPERWREFLESLDEKLQLGLLTYLQRIATYHFEDDVLFLEPRDQSDYDYLCKDAVAQSLQVLANDAVGVEEVKIQEVEE